MSETQKPKQTNSKSKSPAKSSENASARSSEKSMVKRSRSSSGKKTSGGASKTMEIIKYEIKLLALIGYTVLSIFSLHTEAAGPIGHFIKSVYLGLFSGIGYVLPYVMFILLLFGINKNLKKIRLRYTVAAIAILFGLSVGWTTFAHDGLMKALSAQNLQPLSLKGLAYIYKSGIDTLGGGFLGFSIGYPIIQGIGALGAYLVALVSTCIGLLLMTDMTLEKMFKDSTNAAGEAARKTKEKVEQIRIPERMMPQDDDDEYSDLDDETDEPKKRFGWFGNKQSIKAFDYDQYEKPAEASEPIGEPISQSIESENRGSAAVDPVAHLYPEGLTKEPEEQVVDPLSDDQAGKTLEETIAGLKAATIGLSGVHDPSEDHDDPLSELVTEDATFEPSFDGLVVDALIADGMVVDGSTRKHVDDMPSDAVNGNANEAVKRKSAKKVPSEDAGDPVDAAALEAALQEKVAEQLVKPYVLPSPELLDVAKPAKGTDKKELYAKAQLLEETLRHFNVEAKVVHITRGPSITMFELLPSPGIKVSKIVGLSDDIALSLAASQVRIIAPIPGKSAIGVEIPNEDTTLVSIREVIESEAFKTSQSKIAFCLGKDIQGATIVGDLAKMPHMLIAGSTGSGKSVCVNTLITSILYNAKPDEVKFLMIDPKVVELSVYNGIPHLLLPVVTDPKKAAVALNWAVQEMTRRYKLFADGQVRDVSSYNDKIASAGGEYLPKIVVIIDELADLMMVAPNQIEDSICRLAQMARAAGIHLIVATQRPSVDVITGLIKANVPSRIAFAVSSQIDSRTILDMGGAEKLLGKGDMLYFPVGIPKPIRVQGAFVSDGEVNRVVQFVTSQEMPVAYKEEILEAPSGDSDPGDADELLPEAIEMVVRNGQASASMLQRRYKVGYNRAARMIDQMEERGIVGPSLGSKPREVQITLDEWMEMNLTEE